MITIFTLPKPFTDPHIKLIQTNAITSWTKLFSKVQVILLGSEPGTSQLAKHLKIQHMPSVKTNRYGTPLLNSAFKLARQHSRYPYLAYINADIIIFDEFIKLLSLLPTKNFLALGQRWDLNIKKSINFNQENWQEKLKTCYLRHGKLHPPAGSDYFIFPKKSFTQLPPFAVGRVGWDNWMIYQALKKKIITIDTTQINPVIHQEHHYNHLPQAGKNRGQIPEAQENLNLAFKNRKDRFTLEDANYQLTPDGVKRKPFNFRRIVYHSLKNFESLLRFNKPTHDTS